MAIKEPKKLTVKNQNLFSDSTLTLSHLSDTGKCHVMTYNYGEVTSATLNKTEAKRVVAWLNKWIEFKDGGKE